jgi:hypothetical protein
MIGSTQSRITEVSHACHENKARPLANTARSTPVDMQDCFWCNTCGSGTSMARCHQRNGVEREHV